MVVIRDGRIVAAGAIRMKLPAGTRRSSTPTGKWVTPGIVAGFSRLGLAEVDLGRGRRPTTRGANGPFSAAIDVVAVDQPARPRPSRSTAPTGSPARLSRHGRAQSIFAGQGAVIDTGADMDPITAPRKFQFVELGETGADKAGGSRVVGPCPVPQRAARSAPS